MTKWIEAETCSADEHESAVLTKLWQALRYHPDRGLLLKLNPENPFEFLIHIRDSAEGGEG